MVKLNSLLILLLFSTKTVACICWFGTDKKSVKEKIGRADVIVYVSVTPESLMSLRLNDSSVYVTDVIFTVEEVLKGQKLKTVKFDGKKYPCEDAGYRIGERYIIFGYLNAETGKLETNNCNSLEEGIRPRPFDGNGDIEGYHHGVLRRNQEFNSLKKFIRKKTKKQFDE